MRLAGRSWKDGKFWLAEVAMLDAMTQERSRREAFRMMVDLVDTMVNKRGFHVTVYPGSRSTFEIGSHLPKPSRPKTIAAAADGGQGA